MTTSLFASALDPAVLVLEDGTRYAGRAYGARTLAYIDCMRDLDVTVGPALLRELAPATRALFEACRWYCSRIEAVGRRVVEAALPEGGGPFAPVVGQVMGRLMRLPPEIGAEVEVGTGEAHFGRQTREVRPCEALALDKLAVE